jgi:predicted metalloprotease with PDZ domain
MSLIEAAVKRAQGAETYMYARGMMTAFLCDVLMLNSSKTKRSVTDLVREVYAKHRAPAARTDGTAAVLAIMKTRPELSEVIDKYIKGNGPFQIQNELALAGLQYSNGLQIVPKLNGRQKDLLDALGYNNWRRLS